MARITIKLVVGLAVLVLLLLTLWAVEKGSFRPFFQHIGIYPEREKYTVLFFEDSEELSSRNLESSTQSFIFGIENREGQDLTYEYIIEVTSASGTEIIERGMVPVKFSEISYKAINLNSLNLPNQSLLTVLLPEFNRSINFKIN